MAQAIVCHNQEGLVLATDSWVLRESLNGGVETRAERRLFPLGTRALILSAGAPVGIELCEQLSQWLQARALTDLEDVLAVSRDFMAEGYARYLRAHQTSGQSPRYLHFIVGGYSGGRASAPFQAVLWHSEAGELPFRETRLGRVFTLPRRLALEGRITRQIAEGVDLQALVRSCQAGLAGVAERNPETVGGPFQIGIVTASEVRFLDEIPTDEGDGEFV